MSNNYNSQPIVITTTFTGWKANQTLYGSATAAVGIRPVKIVWTGRTASTTNSFSIQDTKTSNTYFQGQIVDGANPQDIEYDLEGMGFAWHDFQVPTLSSGTLLIWYRV
jgi:hypothetical protein